MRGDERADARFVEQSGADLADDRKHRELEFAAFGRQLLDPGRRAAQGQFGGGVLGGFNLDRRSCSFCIVSSQSCKNSLH